MDAEDFREARGGVKLRDDLRAGTAFPRAALQPRDNADDNVVHHQGEQRLIGVPLGLEEGGNSTPHAARHQGASQHDGNENIVGNLVAQQNHAGGGCKAAHQHLTLAAHVPEFHPKRRGDCQGDAQQQRQILQGIPQAAVGAEGTCPHGFVNGNGIFAGHGSGDKAAHHQRNGNGCQPNAPSPIPGQFLPLGKMKEFLIHVSLLPWSS